MNPPKVSNAGEAISGALGRKSFEHRAFYRTIALLVARNVMFYFHQ